MRRNLKKWVSMLLTIAMLITLIPISASAENDTTSFYRIFHLDAGRKYFSVDQIKTIIDSLANKNYTHLELAVGNDGLRFLLDDMSVTANDTTYTSDAVKAGIQAGNKAYYNAGTYNELTQTEMDTIISYASEKGIEIIPLINTPGHMDAILDCMESVGISNPAYSNSARTVDVTNTAAVNFTLALVNKYIQYFAGKGSKIFNMGCDEYANDVSNSGFAGLIASGKYGNFITYVNNMAAQVKAAGMTPMAFNDGIYYNSNTSSGTFDTDIMVAFWTVGWPGYSPASASFLAGKGHKIINTNDAWYYVLGRQAGNSSGYTIGTAQNGVQNTACTDIPGDNDPAASGCMICLWCDTPSASYSATEVNNVTGLISTFATNNPTYFTASTGETDPTEPEPTDPTEPVEVTDRKTITVTVGQTETATISDYNFSGTYTTEDPSIATVEVTGKDATEATTTYTQASVNCNTLISRNSNNWTAASGYYYKADDGNYYPVYAKRSREWSWSVFDYVYTYTWGYSATSSTNNVTEIGTQSTTSTGTTPNITVYTKSGTEGTPASTTVKFTGVAVGTTYVTVGNTRYTIEVIAEDLSQVTPLTVEYWITNLPVTADGTTSKSITAQSAYGENGVDVSTLVPATGTYAYGSVVYWKGTVLDSSNKQTTAGGAENDKTGSGKDFSQIRYYNGNWQYFYEADGTWNTISSTDQVVIYWLQPTEVTKEITTLVKDWGFTPDAQGDNESKVALTVAVVYPDGTVSPAEGDMYSTSTTLFNYWSGRDIGLVAPVNNSDYEISKITVTDGTRNQSGTGKWGTNDTITWDKVTNEAGEQWYDETTYWDETVGGTPMVNGATSNIIWSNYNTAKLVLIYLKPIHYDTNLIVNWVDDSASGALISTMEVAVSSDGTPITFYNGLKQTSALPTEGVGGTFTLDDNAYVTNSSNVNQTFNKNISTVPGVDAQYKSGLYQYVSADLSADGKTLTLHYDIDSSKLSLNYIVDFGLPINVPLSDLVESTEGVTKVEIVSGNAEVNEKDNSITYTPIKVMSGTESIRVKVSYGDSSQTIAIGFTPATTVYYEESFATFTNGTQNGQSKNATQTASKAGVSAPYGYDKAYADDGAQASNGTDVTLATGGKGEFTFTGTGVDIYANSTTETGKMMVYLYQGETLKTLYTVDTKMANGDTTLTTDQAVNGYNIPVVAIQDLALGTYKVKMEVVKTTVTASDGTTSKVVRPVNIDGFRVYNTMGINTAVHDTYKEDLEDNPSFFEVRDLALSSVDLTKYEGDYGKGEEIISQVYEEIKLDAEDAEVESAILNGNEQYNTENLKDLIDNGPKNEIYLRKNQTLVLNLNTARVAQIGLKALDAQTSYSINGATAQTLNASTDMFYTVKNRNEATSTIIITNTGDGILAITKLKICDAPADAIQPLTEQNVTDALIALGYVDDTKYADATANINLVDYTGEILATTSLAVNGEEGTEATFVAADIQALAEQLLPEGYAFVDVSAITDQTVVCGESADVNVQIGKVATLNVTYKTLFGKTAGTATLTALQTSSASSYTFSASEIRKAAPSGFWTSTLISTKVKYGSTGSRTVIGF